MQRGKRGKYKKKNRSLYEVLKHRENRLKKLERLAAITIEEEKRNDILRNIKTLNYQIESVKVDIQIMEHRTKNI